MLFRVVGQATGLIESNEEDLTGSTSPLRDSVGFAPNFAAPTTISHRSGRWPSLPHLMSEPHADATDDLDTESTAPTDDPRPDGLRSADSLVVVNTGNGKGKSSSAFGMMVRGVACGWNVAVVQFIKSGAWKVGEEKIGRELGVDWHAFGDGFTWDSDDMSADIAHAREGWASAVELMKAGDHELVIFDELTYLCSFGWIPVDEIVGPIRDRPRHVNVVITGRDAPPELIDLADTVTEMTEIKHAYQQGIRAMRGLDY